MAAVRRPPAKPAAQKQPKVLTRLEKLQVLSKLEKAGVLSFLENSGITLQYIEQNKLLSKAESFGAISLLTDRGTPGSLTTLGFILVAGAIAAVTLIPNDSTSGVAVQALIAASLGGGGLAAIAGGNFIGELQKD